MRFFGKKQNKPKPSADSDLARSNMAAAPSLQAHALFHLQRAAGNFAVQQMLGSGSEASDVGQTATPRVIQTKLAINKPGDKYEQEADRIANQVTAKPAHSKPESAPPQIQRFTSSAAPSTQTETAPANVDRALASPGSPLEPSLRQDMEQRFGHDFSGVRVHSGEQAAASARTLGARAYTIGEQIVVGLGDSLTNGVAGLKLLVHELAHVVQQRGGGSYPSQLSPSGERVARQSAPQQTPPGRAIGPPTVVGSQTSQKQKRTQVTIRVTGHASPRWRGAPTSDEADANNLALSQQRENAVTEHVKQLLRDALPNQQLVFKPAQSPYIDPGVLDPSAPMDLDSTAIGSKQTLQEAGAIGRGANAPPMRRVDLSISLADAIETIHDTKIKEKRQLSAETPYWAIKMGAAIDAGFRGFGGGGFSFHLKNRKNNYEVQGYALFWTAGLGIGLPIPTVDMGGYEDFTTRQPVNFSDFHNADFKIINGPGFNALLGGWELGVLEIELPGGTVPVDIGGSALGGAGVNLLSGKGGRIWLQDTPDTYTADVIRDEQKVYTSRMAEEKKHRVLFETEKADISATEEKKLHDFVSRAVENYQRGQP